MMRLGNDPIDLPRWNRRMNSRKRTWHPRYKNLRTAIADGDRCVGRYFEIGRKRAKTRLLFNPKFIRRKFLLRKVLFEVGCVLARTRFLPEKQMRGCEHPPYNDFPKQKLDIAFIDSWILANVSNVVPTALTTQNAHIYYYSHFIYCSATTGFSKMPSFSISTSTMSPGLRNTGGFRAKPTPGGVPVKIRSPGASVQISET